jgi:hypothetical protein
MLISVYLDSKIQIKAKVRLLTLVEIVILIYVRNVFMLVNLIITLIRTKII